MKYIISLCIGMCVGWFASCMLSGNDVRQDAGSLNPRSLVSRHEANMNEMNAASYASPRVGYKRTPTETELESPGELVKARTAVAELKDRLRRKEQIITINDKLCPESALRAMLDGPHGAEVLEKDLLDVFVEPTFSASWIEDSWILIRTLDEVPAAATVRRYVVEKCAFEQEHESLVEQLGNLTSDARADVNNPRVAGLVQEIQRSYDRMRRKMIDLLGEARADLLYPIDGCVK